MVALLSSGLLFEGLSDDSKGFKTFCLAVYLQLASQEFNA
jgi:hypothetical protein